MRKRLIERIAHAKKGSLGYTLTELLVVIAIIAVVCAIAIPSVIAIRDALRFAQANNYAKSIFLAAQQNLTEMRSDGGLGPLQGINGASTAVPRGHCGFPDSEWSDEYVFTASGSSTLAVGYGMVLPVNSVESTIRDQQVIIEYNPITGNVYAVFYSENDELNLLELYKDHLLSREKSDRKKLMVGYYDGSGLSSANIELENSQAEVVFVNDEEGIVTVRIPMPSQYYDKSSVFMEGLKVELTIRGESDWGGSMKIVIKDTGTRDNCALDTNGNTILVSYPLDSLADCMSFANLSVSHAEGIAVAEEEGESGSGAPASLTALTDQSFQERVNILPGDNVTIQADVTFENTDGNPAVTIRPGILAGVNPMFDYLLPSPTEAGKYILAVSNGRNLQNLNAIHPLIADSIKSVVFTEDIYWSSTISYYNSTYGTGGAVYHNAEAEAPARRLPYFVPIENEYMFGTADFIYIDGGTDAGGLEGLLQDILEWLLGSDFKRSDRVPTLTDEMDTQEVNGKQIGDTHATIDGQGHKVCFLNIDATVYQPCAQTFYALGDNQTVDYYFTGLFGYANTTINDLHVVNPIVKGHNFVSQDASGTAINMDPATGALLGAGGYNTLVTNCSTYLDSTLLGYNWSYGISDAQTDYAATVPMGWYGVSGEGAVGGLVGYAKSHRTVVGELGSDTRYLAFSNCFAAVPVSGNVRGTTVKDYGYSNGVGGFIGNSQLTNFYNCYSSGNVMASNTYHANKWNDDAANLLGLASNGRLSQGAGGFVGTSHGTRYTNCFSAGNVINRNGNTTTGGFVGMMCYDATKAYGHHSDNLTSAQVAQHTVFDSCYAAGMCTDYNGNYLENFSGVNGKIVVDYGTLRTFYTGDYYKLLAPYAITNNYNLPKYSDLYIFKDSYYLSQYKGTTGVSQDSSNKCAEPITYDELVKLQEKYDQDDPGEWVSQQVDAIKLEKLDADDIEPVIEGVLQQIFTDLDIGDILAGIFGQETESLKRVKEIIATLRNDRNYNIYFLLDSYREGRLEQMYKDLITEGFPSPPWENALEYTTHYYGDASAGKVYPFPKLQGMDYYGRWPEKTLDAGLAYYEVYSDGTIGYYFDREDTSKLKNYKEAVVVSDGYCIFTANANDKIAVHVNGTKLADNLDPDSSTTVTMESDLSPDSNSYYVVTLPQKVLAAATNAGYYQKMDLYISNTSNGTTSNQNITAYFNPNVALSQVNSSTKPTKLPGSIIIRSARQLAELAGEPTMWGEGFHYVQHMNIDTDAYTAVSYSTADCNAILSLIARGGSIGTEAVPFQGSYTGRGYAEQAQIIDFLPGSTAAATNTAGTTGLFGVIGDKGLVDCLDIRYEDALTLKAANVGTANVGTAGVLAGISSGTIQEVKLTLDNTVQLNADMAAGLLAGTLNGTVKNCNVTTNNGISITAINAGTVIGSGRNAVIETVSLVQNDLAGEQNQTSAGLTITADYAGGFAGWLYDANAKNVSVDLDTVTASADACGGYAGYTQGGTGTTVSVKIDQKLTNTKTPAANGVVYAAGLTGISDSVTYAQADVTLNGEITGSSAAGMFGYVTQGKVQNSKAVLKGTIRAAADAAGIAVKVGEGDGLIQSTIAYLQTNDSKILADGCAAGFAVELGGTTQATGVRLGQYSRGDKVLNATATGMIRGGTQAAGYACSVVGTVDNGTVMGAAQIIAEAGPAAGFAVEITGKGTVAASGVTPALGDQTSNYRYNSNSNLTVSGTTAAGFVSSVGTGTSVVNSYALGTITAAEGAVVPSDTTGETSEQTQNAPTEAGFVLINDGLVNGSTANISIEGGHAFAGTNNGSVTNCYGWYGDGKDVDNSTVVVELDADGAYDGEYKSCYFVDLDILVDENNNTATKSVMLFDYSGTVHDMAPTELSAALALLNAPGSYEWFGPATYNAKPYSDITPATYTYPMLRTHYGDWVVKPQYAYGVMYYEKHEIANESGEVNVQWMYKIVDLTRPEDTIEDESLSLSNIDFTDTTSAITEAGYAVFCKTTDDPNSLFAGNRNWFSTEAISEKSFLDQVVGPFVANVKGNSANRYSFYKVIAEGELIFDGASDDVPVVTWYANAIDVAGTESDPYYIRTPDQFAKVGYVAANGSDMSASCFKQMHTITADRFENIDSFSGSYDGSGLALNVGNGNTWIDSLSGSVANLDLTVTGNVAGSIIAEVAAEGSVAANDVTVQGDVVSTGSIIGTVAEEGSVEVNNAVTVTGNVNGSLVNVINGSVEIDSISTGDIADSLFVQVAGADNTASLTIHAIATGTVPADGNGWLITEVDSASVNLGGITVDNSYIQVVEQPETTDENGETISASTKEVIRYADAGTMIGSVSNGSVVTGAAVTMSNTALTQPLVNEISGSTVQSFEVTAGNLKTSLIGSLSGTAATDTAAAKSAVLNSVSVTAGGSDSFSGSGLLVNVLGGSTTVSNCDVNTGTITVSTIPEHKEGDTDTKSFGGITGVVPAGVTLSGNTVTSTLNVTGENNVLTVVGGITGVNNGAISGGSGAVTVNYTQTAFSNADDKVRIGGLVGWMRPGSSITDVSASGAINLTGEGTGSDRDNYFIGGAIAYDDNASYENVTTAVAVSDAWAGTQLVAGEGTADRVNPSGKGTVGKFVGYVSGGSFENCSASSKVGAYQFLGQIFAQVDTLTATAPYKLYTSSSDKNDTSIDWTEQPSDEKLLALGYTDVGSSYDWYTYPATLDGCSFVWTDGNTYYQSFDATYIYGGTETERDVYKATNVGASTYEKIENNPALAAFGWADKKQHNRNVWYPFDTDYFCMIDGVPYQLYVEYKWHEWDNNTYYSYRFRYRISQNQYSEYFFEKSNIRFDQIFYTYYEGYPLYRQNAVKAFPTTSSNEMYMIVTSDGRYALSWNNGKVEAVRFHDEFDADLNPELYRAIWMAKGSDSAWKNLSDEEYYLVMRENLVDDDFYQLRVNVSSQDDNYNALFRFRTKNKFKDKHRYLRFSSYSNSYSTTDWENDATAFSVYRVTYGGKTWGMEFDLMDKIDQRCGVKNVEGKFVELTEASVTDVSVEAAETSGLQTVAEIAESLWGRVTALIPEPAWKSET